MSGTKRSKDEKIQLVLEAYDQVLANIDPELRTGISPKYVYNKIQDMLPLEPMYDIRTIEQIISGRYR